MWFLFVTLLFSTDFRNLSTVIFIAVISYKWLIQGRCIMKLKENNFIKFVLSFSQEDMQNYLNFIYSIKPSMSYFETKSQIN